MSVSVRKLNITKFLWTNFRHENCLSISSPQIHHICNQSIEHYPHTYSYMIQGKVIDLIKDQTLFDYKPSSYMYFIMISTFDLALRRPFEVGATNLKKNIQNLRVDNIFASSRANNAQILLRNLITHMKGMRCLTNRKNIR